MQHLAFGVADSINMAAQMQRKQRIAVKCIAYLYSACCCLLGSTRSVRMRLAQYKLYRAPSDAMMTSYCSFSSLLLALTCVRQHESYALHL